MSATITIPISEDLLERLRERAAAANSSPEAIAAADIERASQRPEYGRLRRLAGTLRSEVTDASIRTDEYIGEVDNAN